ncbi:MAG: hypothetical protein KZQ74_01405 [gamma proteobacterium symbiont of Bathyaustriella thionipta]|nr:hypothetical protein [gamma proteobacterium symbiont of Bathyaustriella thionipta]MCU7951591.1 hypothetical protein [gamma proteobacterium symbiont of Bathyaustriella thionipta]MCU7958193.1 hypothetical protein [gamma proteobacterium symbiont of Bathyaustriella thionipta]MCU7965862.1 hypothetical protein [gamma proteobacterium symbiont of Bathyaustriella thionipta]
MADHITLKTKDICEALEVGRHQLRSWVDNLAPYSNRTKKERSACKYDSSDLLYFSVVKHMIEKFSLPLSFIAGFSEALYFCIREPQSLTSHPFIFITDQGESCTRITLDKVSQEGIVVDLQPAQLHIYQFLGLSTQQTQLQLGLMGVY